MCLVILEMGGLKLADRLPHKLSRPPPDSGYARGCRCTGCTAAHADAARKRQRAQCDGSWTDGSRKYQKTTACSHVGAPLTAVENNAGPIVRACIRGEGG